jgi:predicted nucleic acid-binding protein
MMQILLDTNILLDVFFQREPHAAASESVWQACEQGLCEGYITPLTLVNIFYLAQKQLRKQKARKLVIDTLSVFQVASLGFSEMENALSLPLDDYEDAVQLAGALASGLDAIVTRNEKDFRGASIQILAPEALLKRLSV